MVSPMYYQGRVTAPDDAGMMDAIEAVLRQRGLVMARPPVVRDAGEVDGVRWWEYCVAVEEVRDAG